MDPKTHKPTHIIMKPMKTTCLYACFLAFASLSHGAVTWQTPQNITGDSDVSTNGSSLYAVNFRSTAGTTTVNSVAFTNATALSSANYTFESLSPSTYHQSPGGTEAPGGTNPTVGFASGNFAGLSSGYQDLLSQYARAGGGSGSGAAEDATFNVWALSLNGLISGNTYEVQVWINDSRNIATGYNGIGTLDRGEGGPVVDYNVGNVAGGGGLGQYAVGTFVATGSTEVFTFDTWAAPTANVAALNAFQLRLIPEPTSALLAALGLCAGISRRRR